MPTFVPNCQMTPAFVNIYSQYLKPFGVTLPCSAKEGIYQFYSGDRSVSDKGEILVWQPTSN
jgi:hypothetical protein